jgi:SAM-dependent methyltransferase
LPYGEQTRGWLGAKPDENLVSYLDRGLLAPGRALDLGCGPGRNALHLASAGFAVDAVNLSPAAIAWATDRAREPGADVRFHRGDAFALAGTELRGPYDLVCDSGCFHHLPPHRRVSYLALLDRVLAPGGHLALTCFAPGEGGGSERPDADFYRHGGLGGASPTRRSPCAGSSPTSRRWSCVACATSRPGHRCSASRSCGRPCSAASLRPGDARHIRSRHIVPRRSVGGV